MMTKIRATFKGNDTPIGNVILCKGYEYNLEFQIYTHVMGRLKPVIRIKVLKPFIEEIEYSDLEFFENWTNIIGLDPQRISYNENSVLKFGKYAGEKLGKVPSAYLLFIYDNNYQMPWELEAYIIENEEALRKHSSWTKGINQ